MTSNCRAVVIISGRGSNLAALVDAASQFKLPYEVVSVISNRPQAAGLRFAQEHKIATHVIDHKNYPDRSAFDHALAKTIRAQHPDIVLLAGFLRILESEFIDEFSSKLLNIHPSLLPQFPGLNTHQRAIDAHLKVHGATVHFVTNELDGGPGIVQAEVPVLEGDTAEQLANRTLTREHLIYPLAAKWFAQGRIELLEKQVLFDGAKLSHPVRIPFTEALDLSAR